MNTRQRQEPSDSSPENGEMDKKDAPSHFTDAPSDHVEDQKPHRSEVDIFYSDVISSVSSTVSEMVVQDDDADDELSTAAVKCKLSSLLAPPTDAEEDEFDHDHDHDKPLPDEEKSLAAVSSSSISQAVTDVVNNLSGSTSTTTTTVPGKDTASTTALAPDGTSTTSSTFVSVPVPKEADHPDYARLEHLAEPVIEARRLSRLNREQRRAELLGLHHPQHQQPKNSNGGVRFSFAGGVPKLEVIPRRKSCTRTQLILAILIVIFFIISVGLLVVLVKATTSKQGSSAPDGEQYRATAAPSAATIDGVQIDDEPPEYLDPILASQLDKFNPTASPVALRGTSSSPSAFSCSDVYPNPPPFPGKKGAAMLLQPLIEENSWIENLPKILKLDPYWNYNWGLNRIDAQPYDIEFVPMVWGGYQAADLQEQLAEYVVPHIENGNVKRLLGFNEPDQPNQANMAVSQALDLWPQLESVDLPLSSPSCALPGGPWMEEFMTEAAQSCKRVDWVGVHWYGEPDFESFQSDMQSLYELYERPLLLTEFAPVDWNATTVDDHLFTQAEVLDFMKRALPWLEQQEWVAGYVWFSFRMSSPRGTSSALFDELGRLTPAGQFYASVRNDTPLGDQSIVIA